MTAEGTCTFGKKAAGLTLIFCTAIIWILTSFISESLVAGDVPKVPAFLLTWLATTLFTLYLPALQLRSLLTDCWQRHRSTTKPSRYTAVPSSDATTISLTGFEQATTQPKAAIEAADNAVHDAQAVTAALWATPLWFLAQYAFNLSLALTSVTSNTILSSTSSLFTFGLSVVLLGEKFTMRKLACILACIAGTALVTLSDVRAEQAARSPSDPQAPFTHGAAAVADGRSLLDTNAMAAARLPAAGAGFGLRPSELARQLLMLNAQSTEHNLLPQVGRAPSGVAVTGPPWPSWDSDISSNNSAASGEAVSSSVGWAAPEPGGKAPLLGDLLVLASGALYAAYTVVMRLKMPGEEAGQQVAQFFGYVGLFTTVGLAPVIVLLLSIGSIDMNHIPRESYLIILLEGLLDYVLSDYLWARAVMLVGPTVATLSLSVQIPITAVMDLIVGEIPTWTCYPDTIAMSLIGTAGILAGFVGINLGNNSDAVVPATDSSVEDSLGSNQHAPGRDGSRGRSHHTSDLGSEGTGSSTRSGAALHRHGLHDHGQHGSARSSLESTGGRSPKAYFNGVAQAVVGVLVGPANSKSKDGAP